MPFPALPLVKTDKPFHADPRLEATALAILSQLCQNTGIHMMDSGGASGRQWQRNGGKTREEWESEPAVSVKVEDADTDRAYLDITISLYHYLLTELEYDPNLDAAFQAYLDRPEAEDEPYLALMDEWVEKCGGVDTNGKAPETWYTYNHGASGVLSQNIQFITFQPRRPIKDAQGRVVVPYRGTTRTEWYVVLQSHNGADARGGMSRPRMYRLTTRQAEGVIPFGWPSGFVQVKVGEDYTDWSFQCTNNGVDFECRAERDGEDDYHAEPDDAIKADEAFRKGEWSGGLGDC